MQDVFAIFMNCHTRRRPLEKNNITIILVASFVPRSGASYPVLTFQKRWPGSWMQEWFYVKNDLVKREDIRGIIQHPIWSRFGIRRPSLALGMT
jgi:hypothetical protein